MANQLTLTLSYPAIKQAVKADTYITGQIDKSADMVKNAALAFNEQAGDETYHENKIYRTVKGSLAKFEAALAEYVETSNPSAEIKDNLSSTDATDFTITATINARTSNAFQKPLGYLAQEYIINMSLYYWWQPIKPSLAKDYLAFAVDNLTDVRRCLAKSAPSSTATYNDIYGTVQEIASIAFPSDGYNATMGQSFTAPTPTTNLPSEERDTFTYSSSDTSVATVNETSGAVTLVSAGDTTITVSYDGSDIYTSTTASYSLHVNAAQ